MLQLITCATSDPVATFEAACKPSEKTSSRLCPFSIFTPVKNKTIVYLQKNKTIVYYLS